MHSVSHKFSQRRTLINGLRLFWISLIFWYDYGIFRYRSGKCGWPLIDSDQTPEHVLLVADPQIIDHRSYPGRPALLTYISQLIVDLNLRKNWRAALRSAPDVVFFLGDYMDSGRAVMSDSEYERYTQRFMNIFTMDSRIPRYFIPGNHDIGLGPSTLFSPHARTRYTSHFGPLNSQISIANHTFVLIDAPGLVEEDYKRHGLGKSYDKWKALAGGTIDFVKSFAAKDNTEPTILFSHIPLSRPEGSNCGPVRERGTIRRGVGLGYQNTLGKDSTKFLLEHLKPALIFSGDDHDYLTVKSLSMAMGVKKPGYQMLSIVPPGGLTSTISDAPCLMPDQLGIYLDVYIPLALASLALILIACIVRGQHYRRCRWSFQFLSHTKQRSKDGTGSLQSKHVRRPTRSRIVIDEYGFTLDDNDMDQRLPPPASATVTAKKNALPTILSQSRRLFCRLVSLQTLTKLVFASNRRGGFFREFLCDVRDVAIFPLGIIFLISLWTFLDF
ncbi:Metallo-dependent phosphatase-like protein [Lentinula edodes]|uniref:Metallo-dependent phosphatase-like protein n=1 Tax=Lentinula edodes TaxID=5353 RepID=UPI001E8E9314|nr:Metallo-dependent phosphatase-like protein [Lentinula edodes]KAH7874668.1 Metallo-dependent phosphatase-like protein [Lentinula edodes]